MLKVNHNGLIYHRVLVDNASIALTHNLKEQFDYSFIISYGEFEDTEYAIIEKNACLIDLTLDFESIFEKFNATCRKHVRRTLKNPDLEFKNNFEDREALYDFYKICEHERNWLPIPREEFDNSLIYAIACNGELMTGMTCYFTENRLRLGRIFSRRQSEDWDDVKKTVFSGGARRLVYEFCKFGKENSFSTLDLGGVDLEDPSKAGITQFKMSFGPEIVPVKIGRYENPRYTALKSKIRELGYDIT
jgi:hypothetical protein